MYNDCTPKYTPQCSGGITGMIKPESLTEQLNREKAKLSKRIAEIDNLLALFAKHEGIQEVLDAMSCMGARINL